MLGLFHCFINLWAFLDDENINILKGETVQYISSFSLGEKLPLHSSEEAQNLMGQSAGKTLIAGLEILHANIGISTT